MKPRWLSIASTDLEQLYHYIAHDNPAAAAKEVEKVLDAAGGLAEMTAVQARTCARHKRTYSLEVRYCLPSKRRSGGDFKSAPSGTTLAGNVWIAKVSQPSNASFSEPELVSKGIRSKEHLRSLAALECTGPA